MYITATEKFEKIKTAKKAAISGNNSGFSELLSDTTASSKASNNTAINSTNQLFFLQEITDEQTQKQQAIEQGFDIIKYLDKIRMGLLTGNLSPQTIMGLAALLQNLRKTYVDPQLSQIIDEIDLRAQVELAKFEAE